MDGGLITVQNVSGRRLPRGFREQLSVGIGGARRRGRTGWSWEIVVRIVADSEMRVLNRRYKRLDRATDVLAFDNRADDACVGGNSDTRPVAHDIVVSADTAARQAEEQGHSLRRELVHLTVHGLLHLMGYRDDTPVRRRRMESETVDILDEAGVT